MRVNLLILTCSLLITLPTAAQFHRPETPFGLGGSLADGLIVPIASDDGLDYLEMAALSGDRRASALLAVLLQDKAEIEGSLVRSALYFQVALAAGCSDLRVLAERAMARLSPDQRAAYDEALPRWIPATGSVADMPVKGHCLSWQAP